MAETNQQPAQVEPKGAHFVPDEANSGQQNAAYPYWQGDHAAITSSSNHDRGNASANPHIT